LFRWFIGFAVLLIGLVFYLRPVAPLAKEAPSELVSRLSNREGRLYALESAIPFTGWMVDYFPDSTLKSKSWVSNGLLEGVSEGWHTNGVMQIREHFVAGVSEGAVTKWYSDGGKQSEGTANRGKLEGAFVRWHSNGVKSEEVTLVDGKAEGVSRAWFPSGNLKAEVVIKSGEVISKNYWKDGEGPQETALVRAGGDQ
jgi:antitoxin component YwqK of YwqJK toxin-antitoxin module